MSDAFIIYIARLQGDSVQKIGMILSPAFFDVNEPDLIFQDPVEVSGEVYLAEEELVLHLNASTIARMPCSICNQMPPISIALTKFYHTEPLSSMKTGLFDMRAPLREALLLELPITLECPGGCKERQVLEPFLRKDHPEAKDAPETYFPFSDLKYP
jgi:uncharacterized metal-binding protein YceD (DUF177 family)